MSFVMFDECGEDESKMVQCNIRCGYSQTDNQETGSERAYLLSRVPTYPVLKPHGPCCPLFCRVYKNEAMRSWRAVADVTSCGLHNEDPGQGLPSTTEVCRTSGRMCVFSGQRCWVWRKQEMEHVKVVESDTSWAGLPWLGWQSQRSSRAEGHLALMKVARRTAADDGDSI